ncbi:MAG: hypothetical protein AAGA18_01465 [Verrucomicrobiota bacterium]
MLAKILCPLSLLLGVICVMHGLFMLEIAPLYTLYACCLSIMWFALAEEAFESGRNEINWRKWYGQNIQSDNNKFSMPSLD